MSDRKPLWPKSIEVIGGTGEYESGKTTFGLTICPGPETLYYNLSPVCWLTAGKDRQPGSAAWTVTRSWGSRDTNLCHGGLIVCS